jgi:hypothetical protein
VTAASVIVGELEKLQEKARQRYHSMRQREGGRIGGSRGEGEASPRRNRRCLAVAPVSSGEEIEQPSGVFCRGKREERERRAWAFIGSSFDGILLTD